MLQDPRWSKEPTLASFALFAASKDPNERYNWSNRCECAVGQWLASIGRSDDRWIGDISLANDIAGAHMPYSTHQDWTFGKLADRILKYQMA